MSITTNGVSNEPKSPFTETGSGRPDGGPHRRRRLYGHPHRAGAHRFAEPVRHADGPAAGAALGFGAPARFALAQTNVVGITTVVLRLRSGPGTDYEPIGLVNTGTRLNVLGRSPSGSWLYVEIADQPGDQAFRVAVLRVGSARVGLPARFIERHVILMPDMVVDGAKGPLARVDDELVDTCRRVSRHCIGYDRDRVRR